MNDPIRQAVKLFQSRQRSRALAFGSSNTERFLPGMHWFDCFDLAVRQKYGRILTCINAGISGNTTADLLARFDDDAARYRPHLAFVTVGGNDCNPAKNIDGATFAGNLRELHRRFAALGCMVIFQTYYAPNPEGVEPVRLQNFYRYMDLVRAAAAATGSGLIDHLRRWEALRRAEPQKYLLLMRDGFHVNPRGNLALGVDIARRFGASLGQVDPDCWGEALAIQAVMDRLAPDTVPAP